jgi:hypothetical protein
MENEVFKKSFPQVLIARLVPLLFMAAAIVCVLFALRLTERSGKAEGLRLLEEGLEAAVLQCYITEGGYPESLEYIEENYGIFIDRTAYVVHYSIMAPNIRPNIVVAEK